MLHFAYPRENLRRHTTPATLYQTRKYSDGAQCCAYHDLELDLLNDLQAIKYNYPQAHHLQTPPISTTTT